jgi:hypothetical protein
MEKQEFNTKVHSDNLTELHYVGDTDVNEGISVERIMNK